MTVVTVEITLTVVIIIVMALDSGRTGVDSEQAVARRQEQGPRHDYGSGRGRGDPEVL
jgi:hypothetical protein